MAQPQSSGLPPAPRDVAVLLPPLGGQVLRTSVRRWLRRRWTDGFVAGAPLALLGTGELVRAPCAGYLRWGVPVGTPVRAGDRLALIRRIPEAPVPRVRLGTDVDSRRPVEATVKQLASGCYILGVQGMGKSCLLEEIARQLLALGESVLVFDPHGKLLDDIIARMPEDRLADTYHLDLKDRDYPFALNIFACADPDNEEERDRTRNQVLHAFEKLWPETRSGVYFQKLLPHVVILLIEHPQLTLAEVPRLLRDDAFRNAYTSTLKNAGSRQFWAFDYDRLPPNQQRTQTQPLLNRIEELLAEPVITRILCQPSSTLNIRQLIQERKNLFVRLPINEDAYARSAEWVGTMLMAAVYAATFSCADLPEAQIPGFSLIVDEFQNFATNEYARLFAQGRKYKVKQFLAHQYRDQLAEVSMEHNKPATLTAQTKVIFKVHPADAREVAGDFVPLHARRQRENLEIAPLAVLPKHPHPAVKEFFLRYGQPLLEGARTRVTPVRETGRRRASVDAGQSPFAAPWRDFGGGLVSFWPGDAVTLVKLLNELLYDTEQTGRVDKARVQAVLRRMLPLLGKGNRQAHVGFAAGLRDVLQVLLKEPITVGRAGTTSKDAAAALQHLPERQAYVQVGPQAAVLHTRDLPEPVAPAAAAARLRQLREHTRHDLCRPVSDAVPTPPGEAPTAPPTPPAPPPPPERAADPPAPPADQPGRPEAPRPPRSRRSRPLAEGQ